MLERALQAAAQGKGHCLVLSGEAGLGKSRLLAEARARAASQNFLILQGNCFEQDVAFPYAALIDLLRAFFAQRGANAVRESLGALSAEFVKLLPELAWTLPEVQPTPALDAEAEKRRLFEALAQWLVRLSQSQPLLLIFEDVHWSDETSLDLLHFVLRRISASPVLVLASYRREDASAQLTRLIVQLERERLGREIALKPLARDDVDAMLRAIFSLPQPVRNEFLDPILELTEGNPFFIEEILKDLVEAGDIFRSAAGWERRPMRELHRLHTRSVQDGVQRRVAQLSEMARRIILLAAVAGRRFDFELLRQLTGHDEQALLQVMKELIAAQLVSEEAAGRFVFRHALTQHAIYSQSLALERKGLHRAIGETMERLYADAVDTCVSDLAYHFYTGEVWDRALTYSQRAGEKAQQMYAPHAAVEHFTHALEATRHLSRAVSPALYHARGQAYDTLGDFEAARADFEVERQTAHAAADRKAEWQGLIDLGFLWASRNYARTGEYFQQALALVRTLHDPTLLGHTLNRVGNWLLNVERPAEALRHHREALDIFEELNDRRGLAETLDLLGLTNFMSGNMIEGTACYRRAIELFRELDDRQGLCSALATFGERGVVYLVDLYAPLQVTIDEAQAEEEEAVRIAREIGWRSGEAYALAELALCFGSRGAYAEALESIRTSLAIAKEIEHRQWMTIATLTLGMLHFDLLANAEARQYLERAMTLAYETGSLNFIRTTIGALAAVCIAQNDLARAEEVLASAPGYDKSAVSYDTQSAQRPILTMSQRQLRRAHAELALAQGDARLALRIADQLMAAASAMTADDKVTMPTLAGLQAEAILRLSSSASDEQIANAITDLEAVRTLLLNRGGLPLLWRIHSSLGKLYRVQGRHEEADVEFVAARQVVEDLAARVPDQYLRDNFLKQATAQLPHPRPISPRRAEKSKFGGLTERERQVAAFIAQGKSNREIAGALFVGERTIETHVSNIMSKLGFDTRIQIATWAVEKGLARTDDEVTN